MTASAKGTEGMKTLARVGTPGSISSSDGVRRQSSAAQARAAQPRIDSQASFCAKAAGPPSAT